MDEERPLPGGRHVGGVRIGDTVHRPANPWTPAVHAVLRYLEAAGFAGAPRVLGFDERGREVLTFLHGDTIGERHPWPAWPHSDRALRQAAEWMRRLHDTTAGFVPPDGAVWLAGQSWRPGLVIGHHDASPYNAVWDEESGLVGFVDWDTAGPSSREFDLAHLALTWVPLQARHVAAFQGFTEFEDRSRRLHLLLDAYGYDGDRAAFAGAVTGRARRQAAVIRRMAAAGQPNLLPFAADLDKAAAEIDTLPAEFWRG
ncbi:phosphotransferase [Actinomadura chibensis]|uniref:Phosphotransferase n=1 Tax=Actinomadura chibensis TaxID=392828 RepID=A0A5D0NTX0_9ACTN|nr:phosphotransferase [Actinomadura chibensis]TYB48140.1 phosphotransferase [Actinomadura chibensis]